MSKLVFLIIAAVVIYFVLTGLARKHRTRAEPPSAEPMVPCAHCGINLPRGEALETRGRFFCCEEHRQLASG
ncbi:MAG TPA: PP0621 family protein [Burkholderiales bacterium]|nr:PP0621 family protein [Burkholderiales bacterium]